MFDDVLKGAKKASKNHKVEKLEEIKSTITASTEPGEAEKKDLDVVSINTSKKRKSSGKRADPTYKQVGAYVKKDTYLKIQKLLLDKPDKDFSDLVQELLSTYLDNQLTD